VEDGCSGSLGAAGTSKRLSERLASSRWLQVVGLIAGVRTDRRSALPHSRQPGSWRTYEHPPNMAISTHAPAVRFMAFSPCLAPGHLPWLLRRPGPDRGPREFVAGLALVPAKPRLAFLARRRPNTSRRPSTPLAVWSVLDRERLRTGRIT